MSYKLKFLPTALKEWERLDSVQKEKERVESPHLPSSQLSSFDNHYKIKWYNKLLTKEFIFWLSGVWKRDKREAYKKAKERK